MRWIYLGILLSLSSVAHASLPRRAEPRDDARRRVTKFDFEEDLIESSLPRPDAATIEALRARQRERLIRVRTDFFPEMVQSTADL